MRGLWKVAVSLTAATGMSLPVFVSPSASAATAKSPNIAAWVGRMSLAEKVGQMTQIDISDLWVQNDPSQIDPNALQHFIGDLHVGSVLNGGSDNPSPNTPQTWATQSDAISRYATGKTQSKIPILYGIDAVHGVGHIPGAAVFPQNLGMASTWDPSLVNAEEHVTATDLRAMGVAWDFAPDLDVARDVRWGRYYETFGEDPYLASTFAKAAITGMQGTDPNHMLVAATGKHFVGYSDPLTGQDRSQSELPLGYLRETFLPPFQQAISSGLATVMAQSGSVNGVPVHASHYLLTDLLRGQMHFHGLVVSDWADIHNLYASYHVAVDDKDAIRIAVNAGVDMAMVPYDADTYTSDLIQLVNDKEVSMQRINEAVTDILTVKAKLGLFNNSQTNVASANRIVYQTGWTDAKKAAEESLVLLKNNGALPLAKSVKTILVTGPSANSVPNQMGGWTIGWQGMPDGSTEPGAVTVLQGIKQRAGKGTVIQYTDSSNLNHTLAAAKKSSVIVAVVGEAPYAETAGDTVTDMLSTSQTALLDALTQTGRPVIVVVIAGRPLVMTKEINQSEATLVGFLPGSETGAAVADTIFGVANPSGRLPVSWPSDIGEEPLFYNQLPATNGTPPGPLFPFGYGLSYTSFMTGNLNIAPTVSAKGTVVAKVQVMNSGRVPGTDVVQLYESPQVSAVLQPVKQLAAYARVWLKPGESRTITLHVPLAQLAVPTGDVLGNGPMVVEKGAYTFSVDANTTTVTVR